MKKLTGSEKIRTAVFISGTGSNLKSLIVFSLTRQSPISIKFIISNKKNAKGLKFSKYFKIDSKIYNFKKHSSTEDIILKDLKKRKINLKQAFQGFYRLN